MLVHPLRHWVEHGSLRSTDRLRRRALGFPGVQVAFPGSSPEPEFLRLFQGAVDLQCLAVVVLRRRAWRWAEGPDAERLVAAVFATLRRGDIPEALRYSLLGTMCNGWVTSRRLAQESGPCKMGCAEFDGDCIEHYLYCPMLLPMARVHSRLDLSAVRARSVLHLGFLGLGGDRGVRETIHLDATLMAYNRLRHGHWGWGLRALGRAAQRGVAAASRRRGGSTPMCRRTTVRGVGPRCRRLSVLCWVRCDRSSAMQRSAPCGSKSALSSGCAALGGALVSCGAS